MNIDLSAAFAASTVKVLTTMALIECTQGEPTLEKDGTEFADVTGLIGVAGGATKGVFAISFPRTVIFDIALRMLGEEVYEIDDTVTDLVGEVTNMITGGAKVILGDGNYDFDMALPLVISGYAHQITNKSKGAVIVPFYTSVGEFFIEVCFEETT